MTKPQLRALDTCLLVKISLRIKIESSKFVLPYLYVFAHNAAKIRFRKCEVRVYEYNHT